MLPIPQLRTLKIDIYKRIGLIIMFSVGSLGCIASMVRLKFLIDYGISTGQAADPTYTTVPAIAWSGIEASAAIVAACLPTVRLLFRHISSKLRSRATTAAEERVD
ncbi:putative integral membrane protein [Neofusicoccum parvum UCRNP2]|uniref:Putative integral membrane protein n=1 Tax=Botryosphaeria parva (strain UCR-NP2) TaxID=1287680 RepID=R1E6L9_BOTPV|nr:putative integral membrane protein [Neofusicoccum parvum UCRNP2]